LYHLVEVAAVAHMFGAVGTLKETMAPLLLHSFKKRAPQSAQDQGLKACNRDASLALIAFLLEQEDLFALFTRRMILDHSVRLSTLDADILRQLPHLALRKSMTLEFFDANRC
jgi:hypothetical protein